MSLKNGSNKTMLISCIWDNLRENRFKIPEANADVDTPIDKVAFQQGMNGSAFNVQFDGVDSFCILIHHGKIVLG